MWRTEEMSFNWLFVNVASVNWRYQLLTKDKKRESKLIQQKMKKMCNNQTRLTCMIEEWWNMMWQLKSEKFGDGKASWARKKRDDEVGKVILTFSSQSCNYTGSKVVLVRSWVFGFN